MPGGRRSLTFSEVHHDFSRCEPPSTRRVKSRWTSLRPKSLEMGVQVPRRFRSEISTQSSVRRVAQAFGGGVPQACGAPRQPGRRGASAAGPRSHDAVDSTQVPGQSGCRVHQGQERDPFGSGLWRAPPRFHWAFGARGYFVSTVGRARRSSATTSRTKRKRTNDSIN
jgi:hypothetical protein